MLTLYHYTSTLHLPSILADGYLRTTESNIGSPTPRYPPHGAHVGPDVVWLTTLENATPKSIAVNMPPGHPNPADKTTIRITFHLDADRVEAWRPFARRHGINRAWRRALERGRRPDTWYVHNAYLRLEKATALHERTPDGWTWRPIPQEALTP